jgi:hypothetical protein
VTDTRYGGGLSGIIKGWNGEFDLTQGYYYCFDPKTTAVEDYSANIQNMKDQGYFAENTRSIILSYTTYNIPTEVYLHVNLIYEYVNGFVLNDRMAMTPFKSPNLSGNDYALFLLVMRMLLTLACVIQVFLYGRARGSLDNLMQVLTL